MLVLTSAVHVLLGQEVEKFESPTPSNAAKAKVGSSRQAHRLRGILEWLLSLFQVCFGSLF